MNAKAFVDEAIEAATEPSPLQWLDIASWDYLPVPEREWAIHNRVPLRQVGLFSGEGGTGKSIIELQKNVAHVTGRDWLGSMPEMGPVIYVGTEDEEDEIHRRLAAISEHHGMSFADLVKGGLNILCRLGEDAVLCEQSRSGKITPTRFYWQLREACGDIRPKNISIDTLSRCFSGNEIDRVQVYAFAQYMQALAMVANGSVTVLSHPSLAGMASGSGLSGSTAWHGAFRFRQYLTTPKSDTGEQLETDLRELQFKKNQYGPLENNILLRFQNGLFLPEPGMNSLDKAARQSRCDEIFMTLLKRFAAQGRKVSHKPTSNNYAPTMFSKEAEAKENRLQKRELEESLRRMFDAGRIRVEQYGKPSQGYEHIVAT
jgi:RecA-family ATPase